MSAPGSLLYWPSKKETRAKTLQLGWETVAWCGGWVTVGGTGLVEGEVEVRTDYKKHFKNPRAGISPSLIFSSF